MGSLMFRKNGHLIMSWWQGDDDSWITSLKKRPISATEGWPAQIKYCRQWSMVFSKHYALKGQNPKWTRDQDVEDEKAILQITFDDEICNS